MFESTTHKSTSSLPGLGAWIVGTLLALPIYGVTVAAWVLEHPEDVVPVLHGLANRERPALFIEGLRRTDPLAGEAPGFVVEGVSVFGDPPKSPTILVEQARVTLPTWAWTSGGLRVAFDRLTAEGFDLHFQETRRPIDWKARSTWFDRVEVAHTHVARFGMTLNGEPPKVSVVVDDAEVFLEGWSYTPDVREMHGEAAVVGTSGDVAGFPLTDVTSGRLAFTGTGMDMDIVARIGGQQAVTHVVVDPLFRPPVVNVTGHMTRASIADAMGAVFGERPNLQGHITLGVELEAGSRLPPGAVRGKADVDVRDLKLPLGALKPGLRTVMRLASFVHVEDHTVVFGEVNGGIGFSEKGVDLQGMTYAAPHSDARVEGYLHRGGLSAKVHFVPRPGSGAVEWGVVAHGAPAHPKVALASMTTLRAWIPCEDPMNCTLNGGAAPPAGSEASDDDTWDAREEREHHKAVRLSTKDEIQAQKAAAREAAAEARHQQRQEQLAAREAERSEKDSAHQHAHDGG